MNEENILILIATGGKPADAGVRMFYDRFASQMLHFFARYGLSTDAARDTLQETIIKVVRNVDSFKGTGEARSWIWQIARSCLYDQLRLGQKQAEDSIDASPELAEALEQMETHDGPSPSRVAEHCVSEGIDALGAKDPDRVAALTMYMDGMSMDEIALQIGRSAQATKQYLYECRKKIQPFIEHCLALLRG